MTVESTKAERKQMRELAATVHEGEAHELLCAIASPMLARPRSGASRTACSMSRRAANPGLAPDAPQLASPASARGSIPVPGRMNQRPDFRWRSSLVLLALALAELAVDSQAAGKEAKPALCPGGMAVVSGANSADFADICAGVAASLDFLGAHGVQAVEPVSIEVTGRIPGEASPTAAGCYLEQKRRVYILPFAAFRKNKTWFGVDIDREIFRTLVAHEAAHAVVAWRFEIANPTIQAKEYLAYVAMFS